MRETQKRGIGERAQKGEGERDSKLDRKKDR